MKKRFGFLWISFFISPFMMHGEQRSLLIYAQETKLFGKRSKVKNALWPSKFERKLKKEEERMKKGEPYRYEKFISLAYTSLEDVAFLHAAGLRKRIDETKEMQKELKKLAGWR
jgi:hypothetical protein